MLTVCTQCHAIKLIQTNLTMVFLVTNGTNASYTQCTESHIHIQNSNKHIIVTVKVVMFVPLQMQNIGIVATKLQFYPWQHCALQIEEFKRVNIAESMFIVCSPLGQKLQEKKTNHHVKRKKRRKREPADLELYTTEQMCTKVSWNADNTAKER